MSKTKTVPVEPTAAMIEAAKKAATVASVRGSGLEKCEQYWNEDGVLDVEYHAALQMIHEDAQRISYALKEARDG